MTYDHVGRLLHTEQRTEDPLNSSKETESIVLSRHEYNVIGQSIQKNIHQDYDAGGFWQEVDYAYNIRGWMTAINEPTTSTGQSDDFFGMELFYNSGTSAQYNGNISAIFWQSDLENYPLLQRYEFDYDGLSRLLSADYMERNPSTGANFSLNVGHFDVDLSYDLNGNIETLQRVARGAPTTSPLNPWDATYSSFTLDNLTYDYTGSGNQLLNVSEAASSNQTTAYAQFLDGSNSEDDYDYDPNGNLTKDLNKDITAITYNHINKPTTITYSNGNEIRYYYSADGTKLRQTVYSAGTTDPPVFSITKRSDYLGAIHYEDADGDGTTSSLEITFIQHEEGRYRPNGSEMIYEYNLTDHLGNTRITFGDADADGLADILQENHYYPFGMAMTMSSTLAAAPPNNYLYNGKELQDELDLGWYDYGARMYDASIGRWNGVDALGEERDWLTPYNYVRNNPITRVDPTGNLDWDVRLAEDGKSVEYVAQEGDNLNTLATQLGVDREALSVYDGMEIVEGEAYSFDQVEAVGNMNSYLQGDVDATNCAGCVAAVNNLEGVPIGGRGTGDNMRQMAAKIDSDFNNVQESETSVGDVVTFIYSEANAVRYGESSDYYKSDEHFTSEPGHYASVALKSKDGQRVLKVLEKPSNVARDKPRVADFQSYNTRNFEPYPKSGTTPVSTTPFYKKK